MLIPVFKPPLNDSALLVICGIGLTISDTNAEKFVVATCPDFEVNVKVISLLPMVFHDTST